MSPAPTQATRRRLVTYDEVIDALIREKAIIQRDSEQFRKLYLEASAQARDYAERYGRASRWEIRKH